MPSQRIITKEMLLACFKHQSSPIPVHSDEIQTAVLIPIVDYTTHCTVILTLRTDHLAHYPGQICFPGGSISHEDHHLLDTALRETKEEIGLSPDRIEVIGHLKTLKTRTTDQSIVPFVGMVTPPFALKIDASEVADVFEVPLDYFLDPAHIEEKYHLSNNTKLSYYVIEYEHRYIWGVTAGILVELAKLLSL